MPPAATKVASQRSCIWITSVRWFERLRRKTVVSICPKGTPTVSKRTDGFAALNSPNTPSRNGLLPASVWLHPR